MSIEKDIENIDAAYQAADGENRSESIAALHKLHEGEETSEAKRAAFYPLAAASCGGAYIPYLFWRELARFYDDESARESIAHLLKAFAISDFEAETQQALKPLIIVYYAKEKRFELDKMHAKVYTDLHPDVEEYFNKMRQFVETNKVAVQTYRDKFALLRNGFANFDLLALPLSKLEETLANA